MTRYLPLIDSRNNPDYEQGLREQLAGHSQELDKIVDIQTSFGTDTNAFVVSIDDCFITVRSFCSDVVSVQAKKDGVEIRQQPNGYVVRPLAKPETVYLIERAAMHPSRYSAE